MKAWLIAHGLELFAALFITFILMLAMNSMMESRTNAKTLATVKINYDVYHFVHVKYDKEARTIDYVKEDGSYGQLPLKPYDIVWIEYGPDYREQQ